jgi:UDP-N-acetylglucosamine:LPS N-acetylglucosamine transferase
MTPAGPQPGRVSVLLVCSPGGHLQQLATLRHVWDDYSRAWVTLDKSDARSMLEGEQVIFAHGPTERNLANLARNLALAASVIRRLRPAVIITTGAALAVPFAWVGRLCGARIVFIESLSRITEPSLALRLSAPALDRIYVQWPELRQAVRDSRFAGSLLASR